MCKKPVGLQWRASSWTITLFVGLSKYKKSSLHQVVTVDLIIRFLGIAVDLLAHTILVPVLPFQLERLGYSNVSVWTGWLFFCYSSYVNL